MVDAVSFKGQENDWSLGRYPDGGPFWYALTPRTRDAANAAPPERVIISEILYRPPDLLVGTNATDNSLDEFIELASGFSQPTTSIMTNQFGPWRLNGGVEFSFPADMLLFGPERLNTWVAYAPFVWLPAVMVVCALIGHLVIWRKLLLTSTTTPRP